jgi:NAD(P)-dependent dehydrogenase (short-subunit alcohol dehydrogenase family)
MGKEKMSAEVVVVTGGSAGVGRAVVQRFARDGASIGILARGIERLNATQKEVESLGAKALALPADVSDAQQVEAAAETIEKTFGPITIWINNAMVSVFSPVKEMLPEEYARVTAVTYLGVVNGTLAALKRMLPRDRGMIVQVGSALAYRGIPLQSSYCASKHAIQGFTESLRSELLHDKSNVRVTMVQLPALNTPQFEWVKSRLPNQPQPMPPIFQPEVAAEAIHWAAHHRRAELWVAWPTVKAIVGNSLFPRLVDRVLAKTGYASQQTKEPVAPNRADNVWAPAPGDYAAHGRFDARAKSFSLALWLNLHRNGILMILVLISVVATVFLLLKS